MANPVKILYLGRPKTGRYNDSDGLRECSNCGERKQLTEFYLNPTNNKPCRTCKECKLIQISVRRAIPSVLERKRAANRRYYQGQKGKAYQKNRYRQQSVGWKQRRTAKHVATAKALRDRVIAKYGGACVCCGENIREFLSLDHVNNDGRIERKKRQQGTIYRALDKLSRQPQYQILCMNCNTGKHRNKGICPHETIVMEVLSRAS